jgi:hypothetical protein
MLLKIDVRLQNCPKSLKPKRPRMSHVQPHKVPHSWALPIVKHKAKAIMNLNICRSQGIGKEGS